MGFVSGIDSLVGVLSPQRALNRKISRIKLKRLKNLKKRSTQYAAAKTNRLTGTWSPTETNVNEIIGASSSAVRARIRQLVRDFPYFSNALNKICEYSVGTGITFQSRIRTPDDKLDKKAIQQVEDGFNFWADEADVAGKLHYYEMMDLAKRQDVEGGEFVLIERMLPNAGRYLPLAYQMIEADSLTNINTRASSRLNVVDQGIEYNKSTGRVVAYHFNDPDSWGKPMRVKAENIIHGYQTLRPGQLRGISPFAPAVIVSHDLNDYMDAEIDAAKMAAKYLAFVKADPMGRQLGLEDDEDDSDKKIETLENAIIEYLGPGEDISIATNPRPGDNFTPFVKLVLCMVSVTTGVPYELLSGDYGGLNYSVTRTGRNDFSHALRPISVRHIRHFCQPTMQSFMNVAVLKDKLNFPKYFNNPIPYLRCEWQPPGMEPVDPLRESKAQIDQIGKGLKSPQEIVKARGRDLEDVYREIAAAKKLAEDYDLTFEEVSTAMANNPAAVAGGEDETKMLMIELLDKLDAA